MNVEVPWHVLLEHLSARTAFPRRPVAPTCTALFLAGGTGRERPFCGLSRRPVGTPAWSSHRTGCLVVRKGIWDVQRAGFVDPPIRHAPVDVGYSVGGAQSVVGQLPLEVALEFVGGGEGLEHALHGGQQLLRRGCADCRARGGTSRRCARCRPAARTSAACRTSGAEAGGGGRRCPPLPRTPGDLAGRSTAGRSTPACRRDWPRCSPLLPTHRTLGVIQPCRHSIV